MAISFDTVRKHIVLDSPSHSAAEIWSRWVDWHGANTQWPLAFSLVGGVALGGGLFIPPYFFLKNGWRVRPMEQSHTLLIDGNLFVDGGGVPVVSTLGIFQVNVQYTVPVQAQGISTSGATGPSASEIAVSVRAELATELARLLDLAKINGLVPGTDAVVTATSRLAGDVAQTFTEAAGTVTVSRA
jgi:hypothetical protein